MVTGTLNQPPAENASGELPSAWASTVSMLRDYQQQTRRPLVSLLFLLPALAIYECGVLCYPTETLRNGADVFLRHSLHQVGLDHAWLLPVLLTLILLLWHHLSGDHWGCHWRTMPLMLVECAACAVLLVLLSQGHRQLFLFQPGVSEAASTQASAAAPAVAGSPGGVLPGWLFTYLGAGLYEEFLFRLLLLPLCITCLQWAWKQPRQQAAVVAVILTSLLFTVAHYGPVNPAGETFYWQTSAGWYAFSFRFFASVFFSSLFLYRGIGIAVGAHTLYDVLICGAG